MKKFLLMALCLAFFLPAMAHAAPVASDGIANAEAEAAAPKGNKKKAKAATKKIPKGKTLVIKKGKSKLVKAKVSAKGKPVLSESVPCCQSDDQGCICSADDCDDCKGITRDDEEAAGAATKK